MAFQAMRVTLGMNMIGKVVLQILAMALAKMKMRNSSMMMMMMTIMAVNMVLASTYSPYYLVHKCACSAIFAQGIASST